MPSGTELRAKHEFHALIENGGEYVEHKVNTGDIFIYMGVTDHKVIGIVHNILLAGKLIQLALTAQICENFERLEE